MIYSKFKQYTLFVFVGGVGSALAIILTYLLTEFFHLWYLASYVLATLIAWTLNFYLNSILTFHGHSKNNLKWKYFKFVGFYIVAFSVNMALVYTLTSVLGWYYILSIIVVTFFISFFTFWLSRDSIFTYEQLG